MMSMAPGEGDPLHHHKDHLIYVLEGDEIKFLRHNVSTLSTVVVVSVRDCHVLCRLLFSAPPRRLEPGTSTRSSYPYFVFVIAISARALINFRRDQRRPPHLYARCRSARRRPADAHGNVPRRQR